MSERTRRPRPNKPRREGASEVLDFFERLLPAAVAQSPEKFLSQDGVVAIAVPARGSWTVRFGSLDRPVEPGFARDADLRLWLSPSACAALVAGDMDVKTALRDRQIRVTGDTRLLERLGFLFEVGGSPLNTLLAMRGG